MSAKLNALLLLTLAALIGGCGGDLFVPMEGLLWEETGFAGFTPFIAVFVDGRVEVPMEFVKNDEIVLNLSSEACPQLDWGSKL